MSVVCLLAAFVGAAVPPSPNEPIQFAHDIDVPEYQTMANPVCVFCSVRVEGKVTGNILVVGGDVHLAGSVEHNVIDIAGYVFGNDDSAIDDDLISVFGNVQLGSHVFVGKNLVALFGAFYAPSSVSVGGERVVEPAWVAAALLGSLLVLVLLILRLRAAYRHRRRRVRGVKGRRKKRQTLLPDKI